MQVAFATQPGAVQNGNALPCNSAAQQDEQLVAEALNGSSSAFGDLFVRYERKMFKAAMRVLHHHEDAEDAVQQAFKSAFVHLASFQGQSQFPTWLTRITINEAVMLLRKRRPGHFSIDGNPMAPGEDVGLEIEDTSATPEEGYGKREMQSVLNAAISDLKPAYQDVLKLREIEEHSTGSTARALGVSDGTVKTRVFRARHALREKLTERLGSGARHAAQSCYFDSRGTRARIRYSSSSAGAV
jgi:RNA polymerase sigma-70 factor (ECF subfamily)